MSLALACLAWLTACRSALPEVIRSEPIPQPSRLQGLPAGSALAVRRPTPGVALLSLWLDAGSRDAQPPQLATLSAWWAADRVAAEARVLPGGTELQLTCNTRRERVRACATRLLEALRLPAPSEAQAALLRDRLRAARASAGADESRQAQALALQGLLGEPASSLLPLGSPEHDDKVDAQAIQRFAAAHYHTGRALLIGLGELEKSELEGALARHARGPGRNVSGEPLRAKDSGEVQLALGSEHHIALALVSESAEHAAGLARAFREVHPHAQARVSVLRGLVVLHLSLPGGGAPLARLQSAVFDVRRLLLEGTKETPPAPDGLLETARLLGEKWVARGPRSVAAGALGVGVVWRRDERPTDNDEATLAKLRERVRSASDAGASNSSGDIKGPANDVSARVTTPQGARIEVVRRAGDPWFAAAVRIEGGSTLDPPTSHGRAALLAMLMADGCGFSGGRELDVRLRALDAELRPLVSADGVGVSIRAPMQHAEAALDTLLRCAVRPSFTSRAVEDARARLLGALFKREERLLEAALAHVLSPAAPGRVAAWGTPDGVASVEAAELKRVHTQQTAARATDVWVVADRPPAELARFVARRLSNLPSAPAASVRTGLARESSVDGSLVADARLRVVVGVAHATAAPGSAAPQVFADALHVALAKRVGRPLRAWGTGSRDAAAAGVALLMSEDELDALPGHAQAALREVAALPESQLASSLERAQLAHSAALSGARGWVESAFYERNETKANANPELALIRRLAAEKPSFYVLRPRP